MIYIPNDNTIALQTRKGTDIPNSQILEISQFEIRQYTDIERDYRYAVFRTSPSPIYNCHGLTFASRRTGIYEIEALHRIINDDGYKKIKTEDVLPGDIIIYYGENGDIEHSGVVLSKPDKLLKIPLVVSKWGKYREVIHMANNCPYNFGSIEYYRVTNDVDRPN